MQRVLVVSNLYPPYVVGGAELVAQRQAKALAARGYDVAVFAGRFTQNECEIGVLSVEIEEGFPVYRVAIAEPSDPSRNIYRRSEERRFVSVLSAHQPHVVHVHNISGLGANLIPAAKSFGCKVLVTLHDHWAVCLKNTRVRNDGSTCDDVEGCSDCLPTVAFDDAPALPIRLRRDYALWCLNAADTLLCPSMFMMRAIADAQVITRPLEHLTNGIAARSLEPNDKPAKGPVQFACFSYLGEHKGIPTLLKAAERLALCAGNVGRWHLSIAGHGHLAASLSRDIALDRFRGHVSFIGQRSHAEILDLHARTHAIVLTSEWAENEPVTLLEAIASGTAQIASRIGGNPELVEDGKSGFLVTAGSVDDLVFAFQLLIDDPGLAHRMGAHNATRRHMYDETRVIDRLTELYAETSAEAPRDDIVVLCAGRAESQSASRRLQLMLQRFHLAEEKTRRVRFIWHGWAGADAWSQARLLFAWGDAAPADVALVTRALRAGIPVLVSSSSPLADIAQQDGSIYAYDTLLEALSRIAAVSDVDIQRDATAASSVARTLNALAPSESFHFAALAS